MNGLTLDAGALIAIDRDDRRVLALIARAVERHQKIAIPTTALAQVIRNPATQARLNRFVRQPDTEVRILDEPAAVAVGSLLARTKTYDVVDAHVAVCAQQSGHAVVTSDPRDIRRLAPDLELFVL